MMNIDELRQSWNALDMRVSALEDTTRDMKYRVTSNRVTTSRDRLKRIARSMAIVSFIAPMSCIPLWKMAPLLVAVMCIFFIVMGIMQVHSVIAIDSVNLTCMTVAEALQSVYSLERMRHNKRIIGMILGIPIILAMLYTLYTWDDPYLFYGCCMGVAIGAIIGLMINHRNVELLKSMRRELEQETC